MLYATIRNTKLGGNCGGTTPVTTTDSTTDTSTVATILAFCAQPKSREEIMSMCGLKNKNHFIKAHLKPLLESGARCMICGAPIWAAGSAITGTNMCFTCTTGEADDSEDYEIE